MNVTTSAMVGAITGSEISIIRCRECSAEIRVICGGDERLLAAVLGDKRWIAVGAGYLCPDCMQVLQQLDAEQDGG